MSAGRNSARRTAASVLALGAVLCLVLAPGAGGAPGDATASRVADIRPGPASSNPEELFGAGSTLLFAADDGISGTELWKSNGGPLGPGGTEMIEIFAGINGSTPVEFTNVGGTVFFTAGDPTNGNELRRIAPPFTSPTLVENIGPAAAGGASTILSDVNGTLFFVGNDGTTGDELWKSAPPYNAVSTEIVEDIRHHGRRRLLLAEPVRERERDAAVHGRRGRDRRGAVEERPALQLGLDDRDRHGPGPLLPRSHRRARRHSPLHRRRRRRRRLRAVEDRGALHDAGAGGGHQRRRGFQCRRHDQRQRHGLLQGRRRRSPERSCGRARRPSPPRPPASSTFGRARIRPSSTSSRRSVALLFFRADDGVSGAEPWRSDGGPVGAGTQIVADIQPGPASSAPLEFEDVNGTAFFRAFGPVAGLELWKSTGVGATRRAATRICPQRASPTSTAPSSSRRVDGGGQELWKATIEPAPPVQPGPPAATPKKKKCKKAKKKKGKAAAAKKKKKCKKKRK